MILSEHERRWSRRYAPVLNRLQSDLEKLIGPLVWYGQADARVVELAPGERVLRVGPVSGVGTSVHDYTVQQLDELVYQATSQAELGYPPEQDTVNGFVRFRVQDRKLKGVLHVLARDRVDMYVDTPVEEVQ